MPRSMIGASLAVALTLPAAPTVSAGTLLFSDPGRYTVEATFFEYYVEARSNVRVGQDFDDSADAFTDLPFGPFQDEFINSVTRPGIGSQSYVRGAYDAGVLDRRISFLGHAFTEVLTSPASGDASGSAHFNLSMNFSLTFDAGAEIDFVNAFLRMRGHIGPFGDVGNAYLGASLSGPGLDVSMFPDNGQTLLTEEVVQLVEGDYSISVSGSVGANEIQDGMSAHLHSIAYFLLDFDEASVYGFPGPNEPEDFPPPPPLPPLPAPGAVSLLGLAALASCARRRS